MLLSIYQSYIFDCPVSLSVCLSQYIYLSVYLTLSLDNYLHICNIFTCLSPSFHNIYLSINLCKPFISFLFSSLIPPPHLSPPISRIQHQIPRPKTSYSFFPNYALKSTWEKFSLPAKSKIKSVKKKFPRLSRVIPCSLRVFFFLSHCYWRLKRLFIFFRAWNRDRF